MILNEQSIHSILFHLRTQPSCLQHALTVINILICCSNTMILVFSFSNNWLFQTSWPTGVPGHPYWVYIYILVHIVRRSVHTIVPLLVHTSNSMSINPALEQVHSHWVATDTVLYCTAHI